MDRREPARLALVGLTNAELVADDFTACQKVGGATQLPGNDGLLVPLARADGANLVIFPSNDYELEVVGSEDHRSVILSRLHILSEQLDPV